MTEILALQYEWLKDSREVLFSYCASLTREHLIKEVDGFGRGSIRNLLVHIANVYAFWLEHIAQGNPVPFSEPDTVTGMDDVRSLFAQVDGMVKCYCHRFQGKWDLPITGTNLDKYKSITVTPMKAFTHVLTHEFHHKGQILSMSRQLGYIPPDTDIIRFS